MENPDLACPRGLCEDGMRAYLAIMKFLMDRKMTYTGRCRAFYSPSEWKERGEWHGADSFLVVVHEGGDLDRAFDFDRGEHELMGKMQDALAEFGLFAEQHDFWYTAIYKI
jgi:hypothetical protein